MSFESGQDWPRMSLKVDRIGPGHFCSWAYWYRVESEAFRIAQECLQE